MLNQRFCVPKTFVQMQILQISIHVMACALTINSIRYSAVNGVPENSVKDRAQTVAMATKLHF